MSSRRLILVGLAILILMPTGFAADPPITSVAIAPGGDAIVGCSQNGVAVYSWPELKLIRKWTLDSPNLHEVAFSPSGKLLAVAGGAPSEVGSVELFSWPAGKRIAGFSAHDDSVQSVCWFDETTLVSVGLDHQVKVCDIDTMHVNMTLLGHSQSVLDCAVLKNEGLFVTAGVDQSLRVWKHGAQKPIRNMSIHIKGVNALAGKPTFEGLPVVASASDDRTVRFWQPTIGRMVKFARLPTQPKDIAWSNDGTRIYAAGSDGAVYVIDPDTVEILSRIPALDHWAYSIAVDPNDGSIVVGGSEGALKRIASPQR